MHIEIFSDTICPWCFIGKRRLERALAERPGLDLRVSWRAFQLNPDMPREGMERGAYLGAKFGGAEGARVVYARVAAAGLEEGIAFEFDAIRRTPSTLDSHRLIALAAQRGGRQDAVVEGLFRAYFMEGRDIGDPVVLGDVAAAAGLDCTQVATLLEGEAGIGAVRMEDAAAREGGISGVPLFVFDRQYAVSGAQAPEVILRVLDATARLGRPYAVTGP
jgi:predicted DsbA family dithiol-disulfide isomerase